MKITVQKKENCSIVSVEGSLSNENLREFEAVVETMLNDHKHIVIDLSRLSFILSSGLSAVVAYHVAAIEAGLHFIICGLTGEIDKLFHITDLHKHLIIRNDLNDALKTLNTPV